MIIEISLFVAHSVPQVEVNSLDIRTACLYLRNAPLRDIVAAVQVYVLELVEPCSDVLYRVIRDIGALPDIENMQIYQSFADLGDSLIRDLAGGERQGPEVKQTTCNVDHGSVGDSLAERDVKTLESHAALRQVAHSNITDVVT